ncbi:MAG: hypothetical protein EA403_08745 [Spirochaetaceae bacterium]|nr:MAG: hypothetical protein EA403_08745 [Spirochaetaceae bacterium]
MSTQHTQAPRSRGVGSDPIERSLELLAVLQELNIAADAAENPHLTPAQLEQRFWLRMRDRKEGR